MAHYQDLKLSPDVPEIFIPNQWVKNERTLNTPAQEGFDFPENTEKYHHQQPT